MKNLKDFGFNTNKKTYVIAEIGINHGGDINLAKKTFRNHKNISFYCKSIENIKIINRRKKIFILKGVFHHLNDQQIYNFINKLSKNDSVIAIDSFYHKNQNIISNILKLLDQGNFIRDYDGYKKLLNNFL